MVELFESTWNEMPEVFAAYVNGRDFRNVNLRNVSFEYYTGNTVYLEGADFRGCDLSSTDFYHCNLVDVDFTGANLEGCEFIDCYFGDVPVLKGAENIRAYKPKSNHYHGNYLQLYNIFDIEMPLDTTGQELIVYKKIHVDADFVCYGNAVAKLRILADADRIVYKGDKCRSSCAQVLEIKDSLGNSYDIGCSAYYPITQEYVVGRMIYADSFDSNPLTICSNGIHFFLTEQEAWRFTG